MEKQLTFTTDQKSLIYNRFVAPQNGTKEESDQFIEICETFGLNPLLNDIVFQKYGNRVNFITTRDGLLRVATKQPGYVGAPNANVVKEGDTFKFKPSEGEVYHEFGAKRGKILGAYAVMKHAKHNPVAVFVDFDEYYNANSGLKNSRSGKPNVWDTMPSAMIVKVAEVFVLRRQFPLGGLYTREEMSLENDDYSSGENTMNKENNQNASQRVDAQKANNNNSTRNQQQNNQQNNMEEQTEAFLVKEQVDELNTIVNEIAKIRNVEPQKIMAVLGKPLVGFKASEFDSVKQKLMGWLEKAKANANETSTHNQPETQPMEQGNTQQPNAQQRQQVPQQEENQPSQTNGTEFVLVKKEVDQTPSGAEFVRVYTQENKNPFFARSPETVKIVSAMNDGESFVAETEEVNGFTFLTSVAPKNVNQSA